MPVGDIVYYQISSIKAVLQACHERNEHVMSAMSMSFCAAMMSRARRVCRPRHEHLTCGPSLLRCEFEMPYANLSVIRCPR